MARASKAALAASAMATRARRGRLVAAAAPGFGAVVPRVKRDASAPATASRPAASSITMEVKAGYMKRVAVQPTTVTA